MQRRAPARHAGRRARATPHCRVRARARAPGKGGVGKSSTANSLLNERAANVAALQSDITRPQIFSRSSDGFTVTLIDTPGLLEADAVSDTARSPAYDRWGEQGQAEQGWARPCRGC